jgi:hypothetical protein
MRRNLFGAAWDTIPVMVLTMRPMFDNDPVICRESRGKRKRSRFEVRGW